MASRSRGQCDAQASGAAALIAGFRALTFQSVRCRVSYVDRGHVGAGEVFECIRKEAATSAADSLSNLLPELVG
jgi:hypothetical protein